MRFIGYFVVIAGLISAQKDARCRPLVKGVAEDCGSKRDIFEFQSVQLTPSKPKKNSNNYIHIKGKLKRTLPKGTLVNVTVIHDKVQYNDHFKDFCAMLDDFKTKQRCPVPPQEIDFTNNLAIADYFPSGRYQIDVVGYTKEKRQVFKFKIDTSL